MDRKPKTQRFLLKERRPEDDRERASHLSSHGSEASGRPRVQGSVFKWIISQKD